jgi:serine/threonine protein kinase
MNADANWKLPGFEIGRVLGRGGFATVFEARQLSMDRPVAIKVLTTDISSEADNRRFDRERESLSRLTSHPHVIDVFDAGVSGGRPYLVMRLYGRGSLARRAAEQGPLPITEVLTTIRKLAEGLDAAHALGIVHRDIKPENVLLTDSGEPVLADFGIAALVDPDGNATLTHASTNFFTMAHVAPEVLERQQYAPASDIYALASTTYVMLAGHPAFDPQNNPRVAAMILDSPLPPVGRPDLPQAAEAVLRRAMAKNPSERYPSAGAFAEALAEASTQPAPAAQRPTPSPPSHPEQQSPGRYLAQSELPTVAAARPQATPPLVPPRSGQPPHQAGQFGYAQPASAYQPAAAQPNAPFGAPGSQAPGNPPFPNTPQVPDSIQAPPGPGGGSSRWRLPLLLGAAAAFVIVFAIALVAVALVASGDGPAPTPPTSAVDGQAGTTSPSPTPTPTPTTPAPPVAQQQLIEMLPVGLVDRGSCVVLQDSPLAAVAAVACSPSAPGSGANPPTEIHAIQFSSQSDMMKHFDVNADKGNSKPCGKGGWHSTNNPDVTIGQRTCYRNQYNVAVEAWTYDRQYIEIYAIGTNGNVEGLLQWWGRAKIFLNCPADSTSEPGCV